MISNMTPYRSLKKYILILTTCVLGSNVNNSVNNFSPTDERNKEVLNHADEQKNSKLVNGDLKSNDARYFSSFNLQKQNLNAYDPKEEVLYMDPNYPYRNKPKTGDINIEREYEDLDDNANFNYDILVGHNLRMNKLLVNCTSKQEIIELKSLKAREFILKVEHVGHIIRYDIDRFSQVYKYLMNKPRENCEPQELDNDLSIFKTNMKNSHRVYLKLLNEASKVITLDMEFANANQLKNLFETLKDAKAEHIKIFEAFKRYVLECKTLK